jgi:hypothetical protein
MQISDKKFKSLEPSIFGNAKEFIWDYQDSTL